MKINLLLTVWVVLVALAFLSVSGRGEVLDITKITQGTIKEVKGNSIKIREDPDGKEVPIIIDSNTVYDNVQKLTDLKAGDKVQVDYKTDQNKEMVITITKLEVEN